MDSRNGSASQAHRRQARPMPSPKHHYSSSSDGLLVPPDGSKTRLSAATSFSSRSGTISKSSLNSGPFAIAHDVARGNVGLAYGPYSVNILNFIQFD